VTFTGIGSIALLGSIFISGLSDESAKSR